MKTVEIQCDVCNKTFHKPLNEYNRRIKLGKTSFYCSLNCSGKRKSNINRILKEGKPYRFKNGEEPLNKLKSKKSLIESSMKDFIRRFKRRNRNENVTIEDLIEVWNNQNGKCKYTDVKLVLPHEIDYKFTSNNFKASVDRIDSSKPYSNSNIQFVSVTVNHLKGDMDESEVNDFFNIIWGIQDLTAR